LKPPKDRAPFLFAKEAAFDQDNGAIARLWSGWLPVETVLDSSGSRVKWIHAPEVEFVEPFFYQTIDAIRSARRHATKNVTDLATLLQVGSLTPSFQPSGFIFHVSRCGSTLISNALRLQPKTRVICEGQPFHAALVPYSPSLFSGSRARWDEMRTSLVQSLFNIFGRFGSATPRNLVIKFTSWDTFAFEFIRRAWPDVPSLFVYRDPRDVIVSQLYKPSNWTRMTKFPEKVASFLSISANQIKFSTREFYIANVIAEMCQAALDYGGNRCKFINYSDIDAEAIALIAGYFGIDYSSVPARAIQRTFDTYSKDPAQRRLYHSDSAHKQSLCTPRIAKAALSHAFPAFAALNSHANRICAP
jgi:hypothetical protein